MSVSVEESARRFRERALKARADRERNAAEIRTEVMAQVGALLPAGARAWLIGSLAWGGFGERSDVDLIVAGLKGVDAARIVEAVSRVAGVDVDLLQLEELPGPFENESSRRGFKFVGADAGPTSSIWILARHWRTRGACSPSTLRSPKGSVPSSII